MGLLTEALDHENAVKLAEDEYYHDSAHPDAMNRMGIFSPANQLSNQDALQRLLVNDKVLPKIVDVLGWNISIYHAHANRTPGPDGEGVVVDGQGMGSDGSGEGERSEAVALEEMGREELIAYIRRHRL